MTVILDVKYTITVSGGSMSYVVGLPNNSYKSITNTTWVRARFCKLQKGCTRLAAASDKVYQLLTHGRWFSPASSTTKTGRHNIAESGVRYTKSINQYNICVYCVNFLSKLADAIATHEKTVIYCILYHYAEVRCTR